MPAPGLRCHNRHMCTQLDSRLYFPMCVSFPFTSWNQNCSDTFHITGNHFGCRAFKKKSQFHVAVSKLQMTIVWSLVLSVIYLYATDLLL